MHIKSMSTENNHCKRFNHNTPANDVDQTNRIILALEGFILFIKLLMVVTVQCIVCRINANGKT